jgi:hypothetical protein
MASGDVFQIHGDNILLGNGLNDSIVANVQPTRVEGRYVTLNGIISTGGHDLTIVADTVDFQPGSQIDTSGQPGFGYDAQIDIINGHNGIDGVAGANGKPGTDAGNVIIYASVLKGSLSVKAVGGKGSEGQSGSNGLKGSPGNQHPTMVLYDECGFESGEKGHRGGQGGMPGKPGISGAGGNVDVHLTPVPQPNGSPLNQTWKDTPVLNLGGGASPGDAPPGQGGTGGDGGPVPPCSKAPVGWHGPISHRGKPGAQGDTGVQQVQPVKAAPGNEGLFCGHKLSESPTLPQPIVLLTKDLAAQVSPQTLWDVLQAGEQSYINNRLSDASLSLSFVSMMGRR